MAGWFPLFSPPGIFSTLKIGGGGFVTGFDFQLDGTALARTDTYGGYKLNRVSGLWEQLVTRQSMPSPDNGIDTIPTNQGGAYELVVAPTNTSRFYMVFNGYVFVTTNKGVNWTRTAFAQDLTSNTGDGYRTAGKFMAVDPNNELICYVGTPTKLSVTTDGGATWNPVAGGFTAPTDTSHGGVLVAFDNTSLHPGNVTQTIYAVSYGHGVYKSTNGGTSWTLTSGTPTTCLHMICDQAGTVWLVDDVSAIGQGALNRYLSGTWSARISSSNPVFAVAVNPADSTKVYASTNDSELYISTDSGGTFVGKTTRTITATDIPWLAQAALDGQFSIGNLVFDPFASNVLYNANGIGVFTTTPPTTNVNVAWNSKTAGIENLDVNSIIGIASGTPLVACWDRPALLLTPGIYPSSYGGAANSGPLASGWSADVSPDGTVGIVLATLIGATGFGSSISIPSGSWAVMGSQAPVSTNSTYSGSICASSATHWLWLPKDGGGTNRPWTTTDGGATWTQRTVGGTISTTAPTGWGENYYENTFYAAADKVTLDTYYLYNDGQRNSVDKGIWRSTDGGATWSHIYSGGFGGVTQNAIQLKAVPGQAGHLFVSVGNQRITHPANTQLWKSTDGGATWNPLANVSETFCVGFGKNAPGQSYPSIYIVGWVSGVYGLHRSIDAGSTWQKVGDGFPAGTLKPAYDCYGDMGIYGTVYFATLGNGAYQGVNL